MRWCSDVTGWCVLTRSGDALTILEGIGQRISVSWKSVDFAGLKNTSLESSVESTLWNRFFM